MFLSPVENHTVHFTVCHTFMSFFVREQSGKHAELLLTFAGAEQGHIDEQQQGVVEEALQHGHLHPGIGQVLTAHCCPTDQQGQDLPHDYGLQQMPAE